MQKKVLFSFLFCIVCLGLVGQTSYAKEVAFDQTKDAVALRGSGAGDGCPYQRIIFKDDFDLGDILVRGYHDSPQWAKIISLGLLDYHHSGIVVKGGPAKDAVVMEALGENPDPKDDIQVRPFFKTEWDRSAYGNSEECNQVKYIRWLEVPNTDQKKREKVVQYALDQDDKEFYLGFDMNKTSKDNEDYFYCSKLVWKSYMEGAGIDLDDDGGHYVKPGDLVDDDDVNIAAALDIEE